MIKLQPLDDTELTEYTVQLLARSNITTVRDFLDAHIDKVKEVLRLPDEAISNLRTTLLGQYGATRTRLLDHYKAYKKHNEIKYLTGIASLDALLADDPFAAGSVWEVCGRAGVGKTQLCHTIALNFALRFDDALLYIDTKLDFSGTRMRQMMAGRQVERAACGRLMHQLKVERVLSAHGLLDVLEQLLAQLEAKVAAAAAATAGIKLVIIDAISAVWFILRAEKDRGNSLLTTLSQLIWRLARQHYVSFILVNLSIPRSQRQPQAVRQERQWSQDDDDDSECECECEETARCSGEAETLLSSAVDFDEPDTHQVLGRYWSGVPRVRLLLENPPKRRSDDAAAEEEEDPTKRVLRIVNSRRTRTGDCCHVHITPAGVS